MYIMSAAERFNQQPADNLTTLEQRQAVSVEQLLLGQAYDPATQPVENGALNVIANSIRSYGVGTDPHTKIHAFGMSNLAVQMANAGITTEQLQVAEKPLIEAMKACFDYGDSYTFTKLLDVLKAQAPDVDHHRTPSLKALWAIFEASGGVDLEQEIDQAGKIGNRTRRLAGAMIRFAILKQRNSAFEIPRP